MARTVVDVVTRVASYKASLVDEKLDPETQLTPDASEREVQPK